MKAEIKQIIDQFDQTVDTKDQLPWQRIPVEIWVKIFNYFGSLTSSQPKPLARLRLVCKFWCEVIDENLDFNVNLSDKVLNGCTLRHLRVKQLFVHDLRLHMPSDMLHFRDTTLISSISLGNKITRENFIALIDKLVNVKHFRINASFLSSENNLFVSISSHEQSIFNNFWGSIRNLGFNYDCTDATNANCWTSNFTRLLSTKMRNLRVFTFNVPLRLIESPLPVSFLLQNPSITDVDFRYCVECSHKYLLPNLKTVNKIQIDDLERIQLRSIKLKAIRLYEYGHQAWLPIIKAQKSLANLSISQYGSSFISGNFVQFDELRDTIIANRFTLTSLKLENFRFSHDFDFEIFQSLAKLETLEVHLPQNDYSKYIYFTRNLDRLPDSLEKLVIKNVSLVGEELHTLLSMKNLKNLKALILSGIGRSVVISEFVKILGEKNSLKNVIISPVVLDYFRLLPAQKGKHYCCVVGTNQRQIGKYFWLSRRLEFNCNTLRQSLKN